MSVSRINPTFIVLPLLVLLSGCASTVKERGGRGHMPAPNPRAASHPAIDPTIPVLPPANSGRGGYYKDDGPGENPPGGLRDVPDAVVRAEPYSRYANRPYAVFGKSYTPMLNDQPYAQRGVSSWYGKKFHGQRTSSGEIYDMYKMTAAHPTLPIPSYARITNIATGKQVVVRINDRGPFHASRIVDVSYTAAVKLGLLQKGSHEVHLERILPGDGTRLARTPDATPAVQSARQGVLQAADDVEALIVSNRAEVRAVKMHPETLVVPTVDGALPAQLSAQLPEQMPEQSSVPALTAQAFYVQIGAFSRADKAAEVREQVTARGWINGALDVVKAGQLHRVLSGPFATRDAATEAARALPAALGLRPIVVKR